MDDQEKIKKLSELLLIAIKLELESAVQLTAIKAEVDEVIELASNPNQNDKSDYWKGMIIAARCIQHTYDPQGVPTPQTNKDGG